MCGICGIVYLDRDRPVETETLEAMCDAIRRRGPDEEGFRLFGNVGLGVRSSSITAVGRVPQPIHNENESVWVVFDGEVYNSPQLRRELEGGGHAFYTRTDSEVLVHLYEEKGEKCLDELDGVFAFCSYDTRDRSLFLARDRMGEKPLYYFLDDSMFLFASEVKSFLAHYLFPRRLDLRGLARYLAYEYLPADHSIFEGVKKLLPGYSMLFKDGNVTTKKYWDVDFHRKVEVTCEEEAVERLQALLRESVRKRLMGDTPPGVFLSGGIDSSTVVSFVSEFLPEGQVKTFSMGFADAAFDESKHARMVAHLFKTEHHEESFTSETLLSLVPEVVGFLDEPFADASVFPTYQLSKFARQDVKVALGGDGGDELFAGYPAFLAHRVAEFYEKVPRVIHRLIRNAVQHMPVSFDGISLDFQLKRFTKGMEFPAPERQQVWLGAFSPTEQRQLLRREVLEALGDFDPLGDMRKVLHGVGFRDRFDLITYLYFKFYLPDDILVKVDRASMAASLKVRAPFLDKDLVEFATALPIGYKLKGLRTKHLLKRAMRSRLPRQTIHRRKKGFGVPISRWLRGPLKSLALEYFNPARLRCQGLFDEASVGRLLREHCDGRCDNRKPLWTLLMFQLWYDRYMTQQDVKTQFVKISNST